MHTFISFILALAVLCSKPSTCSTNYIYNIVSGNLAYTWHMNFSLYINDFTGVVLQCFDTANNQFGIKVIGRTNKKFMQIKFNKKLQLWNLMDLCGCDPCDKSNMSFSIQAQNRNIDFRCNNYKTEVLHIDGTDNVQSADNANEYPIPKALTNKRLKLFLMIGNIGPYIDENNRTIYPLRDQMVGCLREFYFGDPFMTPVSFEQEGNKMRPLCSCNRADCNGGTCHQGYPQNRNCDCSMTALNGPYCKQSLTTYFKTGNKSFQRVNKTENIYMKMTWGEVLDKVSCLLQIVLRNKQFTLSINKSRLCLDSIDIFDYKTQGINFVSVNVTNNGMVIKTKNYESKVTLSLAEVIKVNVGFSENKAACETFEGKYDLFYDPAMLTQINSPGLRIPKIVSTEQNGEGVVISTREVIKDDDITNSDKQKRSQNLTMIIVIGAGVIIVVIITMCAAHLIVILRKKKVDTTSNTYDHCASAPDPYGLLHYEKIDSSNEHIDIDDYMVPTFRSPADILPSIPP